jgi:hypothetical protein
MSRPASPSALRAPALAGPRRPTLPSADFPVVRSDPALWEDAKRRAISRLGGKFSARAMQLALKIYKNAGGTYLSRKPPAARNALARWSREDWGYVGYPKRSRYLPAAAAAALTPSEKRRTNAAKRGSLSQWSRQPRDVREKTARIRRSLWGRGGRKAGLRAAREGGSAARFVGNGVAFSGALEELRALERRWMCGAETKPEPQTAVKGPGKKGVERGRGLGKKVDRMASIPSHSRRMYTASAPSRAISTTRNSRKRRSARSSSKPGARSSSSKKMPRSVDGGL